MSKTVRENSLDTAWREILKSNYGEPIGGEGTTHWYINDYVLTALKSALVERLPKKKYEQMGTSYYRIKGYNQYRTEVLKLLGGNDG